MEDLHLYDAQKTCFVTDLFGEWVKIFRIFFRPAEPAYGSATARKILKKRGVHTTLYLGVGKKEGEKMIAHAWLRCGSFYVTGGTGEEFAMVAKFSN